MPRSSKLSTFRRASDASADLHGSETPQNKQALENKIYLIKKMIKNEKSANEMISSQLSHLTCDLHMENKTVNRTLDHLKSGRSGAVPQKM